jgi:SAM-dependent methyltransferase
MMPEECSDPLLKFIDTDSIILDVGSGDGTHSKYLSAKGYDVVAIDIASKALNSPDDDYEKINADIVNYKFNKKFDAFQALCCLEYMDNYKQALKNIYNHLRPIGYGLIQVQEDKINVEELTGALQDIGFKIQDTSSFLLDNEQNKVKYFQIIVKKDEQEKVAKIDIINTNNKIATFYCDIAKTFEEKVAGLQVYSSLSDKAGLLFEYKRPEDVIYHMGKVSYPIDIIFLDNDLGDGGFGANVASYLFNNRSNANNESLIVLHSYKISDSIVISKLLSNTIIAPLDLHIFSYLGLDN